MTIREKLENYLAYTAEMMQLDEELRQCHTVTDSVKGSQSEYPFLERTIPIIGIDLTAETLMRDRRKQLAVLRGEVEAILCSMEDSFIATILRAKYVQRKTWEQVATTMGEGYTPDAVRMACNRYFERI